MHKTGDIVQIKPELVPVLASLSGERKIVYDALSAAQTAVSLAERKFFKAVYEGMPEMKGCSSIYDQERGNLIVAEAGNDELTRSIEG